MNRFPDTSAAEDRAAMQAALRDDQAAQIHRMTVALAALDEYAWGGIAAVEFPGLAAADVAATKARADALCLAVAPLVYPHGTAP